MPFTYCSHCSKAIDDWRESYLGCDNCKTSNMDIEEAFEQLMDEVEEMQKQIAIHFGTSE